MPETIDLLMTTQNRHEAVEILLRSLVAQTRRNFRLLAGVQEPKPSTLAVLKRYEDRIPMEIVPLPLCGLSRARNLLLPHVKGAIIAFTDDDCLYPRESLERVEDFFRANANIDVCVGRLCAPGCGDVVRQEPRGALIGRYGIFFNCPSAVCFYRTQAVRQVGLFDEDLGTGAPTPWQSGEETDYALRLLKMGGRIRRDESITVEHPLFTDSPNCYEKSKGYGRGRMAVLKKHGLPIWFTLVNIAYPFVMALIRGREKRAMYRGQFCGRLQEFFDTQSAY